MTGTFLQPGNTLELTVAGAAVTSGQPALVGDLFGIWTEAGAVGAVVAFETTGVHELALKSGDTPAEGAKLYWDDTLKHITETGSTGFFPVGVAAKAVASGTLVEVRLDGIAVTAVPA